MKLNEKNVMRVIATVAILIIILFAAFSLSSCGAVNHLEESHYQFYDHTKGLIVVQEDGSKLYCTSPSGTRFYRVHDVYNLFTEGDTIDLRHGQNRWVYQNTAFIKKLPK